MPYQPYCRKLRSACPVIHYYSAVLASPQTREIEPSRANQTKKSDSAASQRAKSVAATPENGDAPSRSHGPYVCNSDVSWQMTHGDANLLLSTKRNHSDTLQASHSYLPVLTLFQQSGSPVPSFFLFFPCPHDQIQGLTMVSCRPIIQTSQNQRRCQRERP